MSIDSTISRREFLDWLGKGFAAAGAATVTVPGLAYAEDHSQTEREVEEILGIDVKVDNFEVIRNGGEVLFDIRNPRYFRGQIGFSEQYLRRNPEAARRDLRAMYELKKQRKDLDSVSLWSAHISDDNIIRSAQLGEYSIPLESDWSTIDNERGLKISSKESGYQPFYISLPSDKLDERAIKYLKALGASPPKWGVEKLWDLDVDVFKTKADPRLLLKGANSTMWYDPKTSQFYVGGLWKKGTKVLGFNERNRQLRLNENGAEWTLQMIDTKENRTCSAYRATRN